MRITRDKNYDDYWIGLTDLFEEGHFYWAHSGIKMTDAIAAHWNDGEPNNAGSGGEDCVEITPLSNMNDGSCTWERQFICQLELT